MTPLKNRRHQRRQCSKLDEEAHTEIHLWFLPDLFLFPEDSSVNPLGNKGKYISYGTTSYQKYFLKGCSWSCPHTWSVKHCLLHTIISPPRPVSRPGFPHSSVGKESACNARDPSSVPGLGGSSGEGIGYPLQYSWFSLVAQLVNNLPAMRETWVWSLGSQDSLEKGIPVFWPGELQGLYSPRVLRDRTCLRNFIFHFQYLGYLQNYSCS